MITCNRCGRTFDPGTLGAVPFAPAQRQRPPIERVGAATSAIAYEPRWTDRVTPQLQPPGYLTFGALWASRIMAAYGIQDNNAVYGQIYGLLVNSTPGPYALIRSMNLDPNMIPGHGVAPGQVEPPMDPQRAWWATQSVLVPQFLAQKAAGLIGFLSVY